MPMHLNVVGQKCLAQEWQDDLGLSTTHLAEMETSLTTSDDLLEKLFLLLSRHDLTLAVDGSLVARKLF